MLGHPGVRGIRGGSAEQEISKASEMNGERTHIFTDSVLPPSVPAKLKSQSSSFKLSGLIFPGTPHITTFVPEFFIPPLGPFPSKYPRLAAMSFPFKPRILCGEGGGSDDADVMAIADIVTFSRARKLWLRDSEEVNLSHAFPVGMKRR